MVSRRDPLGTDEAVHLFGVPVADDDCFTLVDLLTRVGRAEDHELAGRIVRGLESGTVMLALALQERDLLLAVLEDPPAGLEELRGVLARDHRDRQ